MQTKLDESVRDTPEGREAEAILRTCTHCGFCLTTCPTYQLLGDELDSPRGRIYLIKQMLEGGPVTGKTQMHLDRCLTCRACETTCPSGVRYGHLVDIGRGIAEQKVGRKPLQSLQRSVMRRTLTSPAIFGALLRLGQFTRPMLPRAWQKTVPPAKSGTAWPKTRHSRTMLVLDGCVQPALQPNINAAAARLLDRLGVTLMRAENAGCCGALSYHLNAHHEGLDFMRRNIDAWLPLLNRGAEAIVMTASGCGVAVKEYGHLLKHDPGYADKAARISAATRDISEIMLAEKDRLVELLGKAGLDLDTSSRGKERLAFHSPCTLQHGQKIIGVIEELLGMAGFELTTIPDQHLCCGSAGTYSLLQKELSQQLLKNKVGALESGAPSRIVTANIGCLTHLQNGTALPVRHWIELLDERTGQ
ncbi:MAG: glycolate oxidase subunit GlcF [Pseudomonadota bacterium]